MDRFAKLCLHGRQARRMDHDGRSGSQHQQNCQNQRRWREQPAATRGNRFEQRWRIDSAKANRQDVGKSRQAPPPAAKVGALEQLLSLSGCVGEEQAALVQSSQECMGGFQGEPVRRETLFETGFDLRQAGLAVEHFQDSVLFVAEVEVLQRHRVFNQPIAVLPVFLRHDRQVRPAPQRKRPIGSPVPTD